MEIFNKNPFANGRMDFFISCPCNPIAMPEGFVGNHCEIRRIEKFISCSNFRAVNLLIDNQLVNFSRLQNYWVGDGKSPAQHSTKQIIKEFTTNSF